MMYTLKKLGIDEGATSLLGPGYESHLPDMMLIKHDFPDEKIDPASLEDLVPGWQVFMYDRERFKSNFHRTSKIREIVSREENRVVFKTETSTYEINQHA